MINADTIYQVTNRSGSRVIYSIPELNVRREFSPNETKKIRYEELEKLSYRPGGDVLLAEYLMVKSAEVLDELNMAVEPEYNMDVADIKELMLNGSLDAFKDCLDFAPDGVKQIIKDLAVSMPLNDVAKRAAIKESMGFDVNAAVANNTVAATEEEGAAGAPKRRVVQTAKTAEPTRRAELPQYKIVNPKE